MEKTIDDLKAYCIEEETTHRVRCKRYDDASGYTRSKNNDIRTASAVREELLGDYYQQIASIIRKYQQITEIVKAWREVGLDYDSCDAMENIERIIENGKND